LAILKEFGIDVATEASVSYNKGLKGGSISVETRNTRDVSTNDVFNSMVK
jgi:hypothetical protein